MGKRRFLRVKKSSGKNPAAEALVNSLVMMEGQSTTTMEILEEHDEATSSNDQEVKSPYHSTKLFNNFLLNKTIIRILLNFIDQYKPILGRNYSFYNIETAYRRQ